MTRNKTSLLTAAAFAGLFAAPTFATSDVYTIDPEHTSVIASWSHFGFSNPTATFHDVEGTIDFDYEMPENSSISVTLPVNTVDTYVEKLTNEFLGKDYFNVDMYPMATFESTRVIGKDNNNYEVYGNLTIHGVTKNVMFNAKLNKKGTHPMTKNETIGFDAHTEIQRSDFGLDKYVPNVSDSVDIRITTEAQVMDE